MFPVGDVRRDLSPKERILGIEVGNHTKAFSLDWLRKHPGVYDDIVGNLAIQIEVSPAGEVVAVRNKQGKPIAATYAYWFAWQAFHPNTEVAKD